MAPARQSQEKIVLPDSLVAHTPDYDDFIAKLEVYHAKRNTSFEPKPRVGSKEVDLQQLFRDVVEHGGYDKISAEKLAWRNLGEKTFGSGATNLPALAFSLKTVYYKQLAAYEISTIWKQEPPPKEILEDVTAKGAALLTRTLDNFKPSGRREASMLGNDNSEASGDEGTPVRERNASEETPGSGGRATRGLRQAPPQRILFQPEAHSARPSRHASSSSHGLNSQTPSQHQQRGQQHAQQPPRGSSHSYNPNMESMSHAVATYEPRTQMPLTLRPVITPGNNPHEFARRQRMVAATTSSSGTKGTIPRGMMLPGTGFDGPNIYVRCLCALKSGIPAEQDYALHHLVKISMERGDKYRFESFPGLAEALIDKLLEVGALFYKVHWEVAYFEDDIKSKPNALNGTDGTPDILQKIQQLTKLDVTDSIQTELFSDALLQINEAALTLRNMVMLEENAEYVSELRPLRDWLSIALNLPNLDCVVELKHYALDIAEQLTKYLSFEDTDPLYQSLLAQLLTSDRGAILTSLKAISRISMNLESNNLLSGVPGQVLQNIMDWTLLVDQELVDASLDFLYQFTAVSTNVEFMLTNLQLIPLVNQLTRLLMHGAQTIVVEKDLSRPIRIPPPQSLARCPEDLLTALMKLEEPERSSRWLRCLYEEDPDEAITQIALWQAYQAQFSFPSNEHKGLLAAADFIKNVSTTFGDKANAQVQSGVVQKFIIKGIRMRHTPLDFRGQEYSKCLWKNSSGITCGSYFMSPTPLYEHVIKAHLAGVKLTDGKFDNTDVTKEYACFWGDCQRFHDKHALKLHLIASHVKTHLPATPKSTANGEEIGTDGPPPAKRMKPSYLIPADKIRVTSVYTAMDDRREAAGVPLSAVLVLRNLARNIPKTEAEDFAVKEDGISWIDRLFKPVEPRLFEVLAHNKALAFYMTDLLSALRG